MSEINVNELNNIAGGAGNDIPATYTVVPGDNLSKIAAKFKTTWKKLYELNKDMIDRDAKAHGVKSNFQDYIYPGQVLTIPQVNSTVSAYESEVIRLVNQHRTQNGLSPLTANWELSRVARHKSQDMADNRYFSHTSPTYGTPFQMIRAFGLSFRTAGENIAYGQKTPQAVVNTWMNSSGHRANILNSSYTQIGVGYVSSGNYWTQMFIG